MDGANSTQSSSAASAKRKGKQCAAFGCSNAVYGAEAHRHIFISSIFRGTPNKGVDGATISNGSMEKMAFSYFYMFPWELILTEPVPEMFKFVPIIGQKSTFPAICEEVHPVERTAFLHQLVLFFGWRVQPEDSRGEFQKKDAT